ncbi:MAG: Zn-dependent alcohol dehydrogenase [candidate division NC10 bacterium]|nr:Zn-dependent alcohol dehydrogenase [candidate division NC10 bacterium]
MKALAAVLWAVGGRLDLREVEVQAPENGEVLVRMAACGICHTDLHVMTGHVGAPLPAVLGHEGAGIVAEVGPGVRSVTPGDHVIPLWRLSCGVCEYCSDGRPALCNEGMQVRSSGCLLDGSTRFRLDGQAIKHFCGVSSFSEYCVIPERGVLKIPDDLPLDRAALLGCAVVSGVGAVFNAARVRPGSSVAVFGTGGVGLNVVQGAAIAGAEKIIAVDVLQNKLEWARQFGATHTVNATTANPVEQVRALTGGKGVHYAFEVIGQPATMRQAYECLAKRGMAVVLGVTPMTAEVSVPAMSLVFEERILTGSIYGAGSPRIEIPKLIDLYRAGKLKLDELLTRTYPFRQINEAYAALERGELARGAVTF